MAIPTPIKTSAIFSVIAVEWPQVKSALTRRIQRLADDRRDNAPRPSPSCMNTVSMVLALARP